MIRKAIGSLIAVLLAPLVLVASLLAQEAAPALTEAQRLQITNISQALELAQLRAQLAQRDFDQARERLRVLLLQLERPGYVFDVQTMTYRVVADAPKP